MGVGFGGRGGNEDHSNVGGIKVCRCQCLGLHIWGDYGNSKRENGGGALLPTPWLAQRCHYSGFSTPTTRPTPSLSGRSECTQTALIGGVGIEG